MHHRRRREYDWKRACEEAALRHRRKNDLRVIVLATVLTFLALLVYYTYFAPV